MKLIADHPSPEMYRSGLEIDVQCARCGSSIDTRHCEECGGDTRSSLSHDVPCDCCRGAGVLHICLSSAEYCRDNPMAGREDVPRGKVEWFTCPNTDPPHAFSVGNDDFQNDCED